MPLPFIASAELGAVEVMLIIAAGILALPAFVLVRHGLEYCYLLHARRFCTKNDYKVVRWKRGPAFDNSGVKTEFTAFELDCVDAQGQRKLVRLLIWLFGIRKVLTDEVWPQSEDESPPSA
jgi:hypothetical protein